jgi:Domain of unknown function (DUF4424)
LITGGRAAAAGVCMALAAPALAAAPRGMTTELGTGGLDFVRDENVELRAEQLFVSLGEIRVTYHLFNTGDRPVTHLVAFPMPDIAIADGDTDISVPTRDPVNFLDFTTQANGKPVAAEVEQKAYAKGLDRTGLLHQLNIPLAPHLAATYAALDALPQDKWRQLVDLGIAEIVDYAKSPDFKMVQHLEARWTLKTTYYWQQIFPAQQELVIEHRYKPSVGATSDSPISVNNPDMRGYEDKYCTDKDFVGGVERARNAVGKVQDGYLGERRIDYLLKTGADRAGPIADFTLTVDKGRPDNLVSFCGSGITKLSPAQFQVHYLKYTPSRDLAVLFVVKTVPE